jgi:hypothetical protein
MRSSGAIAPSVLGEALRADYGETRASGGKRGSSTTVQEPFPIGAARLLARRLGRTLRQRMARLRQRKQQYDPDNILTPGPGMF